MRLAVTVMETKDLLFLCQCEQSVLLNSEAVRLVNKEKERPSSSLT
jgi:hypothetical protein